MKFRHAALQGAAKLPAGNGFALGDEISDRGSASNA
jgi:hypothetical protein